MEPNWWLIVRNKETGHMCNAEVFDSSEDFDEVARQFKQNFPQYEVADGGMGLENRPLPFIKLPYI